MTRFIKTPAEVLDYGIDFSKWLNGDSIQSVTWSVDSGISVLTEEHTSDRALIWLSGGTVGKRYLATCTARTVTGLVVERTIEISVVEMRVAR